MLNALNIIAQTAMQQLWGSIGGIAGLGGGGPFGGLLSGIFGGLFGGGLPIATLAGGGVAQPFRPAIVGEEGRELIMPFRPSLVVPHRETEALLAGGGAGGRGITGPLVNLNLNISPGVPEAVRREVMAIAPKLVKMAEAGVADSIRRNRGIGKQIR
jgi:hypothetical protein